MLGQGESPPRGTDGELLQPRGANPVLSGPFTAAQQQEQNQIVQAVQRAGAI